MSPEEKKRLFSSNPGIRGLYMILNTVLANIVIIEVSIYQYTDMNI